MKRLTMHSLFAAAALTAVAGGASAQTMKAEIPFSFQAGGTAMAPGSYTVKVDHGSGNAHFLVRNNDTAKAVMLVQSVEGTARKTWRADGQARLGFECAGARCALREVWSGADSRTYYLNGPKLGGNEAARSAEVALTKAN
jgi:hypothetical protein